MRSTTSRSSEENLRQASGENVARKAGDAGGSFAGYGANRPATIALQRMEALVNQSAQAKSTAQYQKLLNNSPRVLALQKKRPSSNEGAKGEEELQLKSVEDEEATAQQKAAPLQLPDAPEEDEPPQLKSRPNNTGLPDQLKAGVESLSGISMDGVKVHYNSPEPAQLGALAYTRGTDIHVGPGQEKHLPHEAWHVVQQSQGRVQPTAQMKGVALNDDTALEREADVMGEKANANGHAIQMQSDGSVYPLSESSAAEDVLQLRPSNFYRSYTIPIAKDKFDGFKGARVSFVAKDINKLRTDKVITTNPGGDFIGGHLLKAELGGTDTIDNVVPWNPSAESRFAHYEDTYKQRIIAGYLRKKERGETVGPDEKWEWPFHLSAEFKDRTSADFPVVQNSGWSESELRGIFETLSAIPSSVMVNAGNSIDFFDASGSQISGDITINKKPPGYSASENAPARQITFENIVDIYSNRFKANLDLLTSRGNELVEDSSAGKGDAYYNEVVQYWQSNLDQALDRLLAAIDSFPTSREPVAAPLRAIRTEVEAYTRQPEMTKAFERMRRFAIDNPIEIQRRTVGATKVRLDELIARYEPILKNVLFDFETELNKLT